jgi:Leucine-rich repeat (LRR) protein/serine/threonine protein phosphatase PrpC
MGQDESLPPLRPEELKYEVSSTQQKSIPFFIPPEHPIQSISITRCRLTKFPTQLMNLQRLELKTCQLFKRSSALAETEFVFPRLEALEISDNELTEFPASITKMRELKTLVFTCNKITTLPRLNCPKLAQVDLFVNQLKEVPKDLPPTLTTLKLGFNYLAAFELRSDRLQELNLSGNVLQTIGPNCFFRQLTSIDLSCNCIFELNDLEEKAPNLKTLILAHNFLRAFPKGLPYTIIWVDVGYNEIATFEEALDGYRNLAHLDLRSNPITELPALPPNVETVTVNCTKLVAMVTSPQAPIKTLDFAHCEFTAVPNLKAMKVRNMFMTWCHLDGFLADLLPVKLKTLDLSYNQIKEIDPSVFRMPELRTLRLVGNEIKVIPALIGQSALVDFAIGQNPVKELPPLPRTLETIDCCRCQFTSLPNVFRNNRPMKSIDFSCNRISTLPYVPRATELNFSLNGLTSIPDVDRDVAVVDFSFNPIQKFILERQYTSVDISHCRVHELFFADEDAGCPDLTILKLSYNPKCQFAIDFQRLPRLIHLDLCLTQVSHPFPVLKQFVDFVLADPKFLPMAKDRSVKFYSNDTGYSTVTGPKGQLEDALVIVSSPKMSIYAVVDGHGGNVSSHEIARGLPSLFRKVGSQKFEDVHNVFAAMEALLYQKKVSDGATVGMAMIQGNRLAVAHIGDVRVLLVKKSGKVVPLTRDHRASSRPEIDLVKRHGSYVENGQVQGQLNVTRSLGDFHLRGVLHRADLSVVDLDADSFRLVIASSAVFDVLDNAIVARLTQEEKSVHRAASLVKHLAVSSRAAENAAVVVVDLERRQQSDSQPRKDDT